jgi:hypothetical protein
METAIIKLELKVPDIYVVKKAFVAFYKKIELPN